jgi:N-hydroxyarylamine O-acetyltransferase
MTPTLLNKSDMTLNVDQLDAYLARVGMVRPITLDLCNLTKLHRAHLTEFTWEAIDAFMGWPSSMATTDIFTKMVEGRRGGWCFEMNGLFGAALNALGFRVTRLSGCVDRPKLGDIAIGNHLTLRVDLDCPYLAEVGVGDGFIEPVLLAPGLISQRGFNFAIKPTEDGWLRFHNHINGIARTIDFRSDHSDEAAMLAQNEWLLRDPGSPFTSALVAFRHSTDGYVSLQNACLRRVTAAEITEQHIKSADHLADIFETVFDLDVPEFERVWEKLSEIAYTKAD